MKRTLFVLACFGLIGGVMAGITGAAYFVNILIARGAVNSTGLLQTVLELARDSRIMNVVIFMLTFVMILATLLTIAERKWSALMQDRIGPNRAGFGPFKAVGIPHTIADALKMVFKEDFRPGAATASRVLFGLAPVLAFAPVFALFAVVPPGPEIMVPIRAGMQGILAAKDQLRIPLVVSSPDFGLLYVFAVASLAVYGTSLAGWASNNKFALLGGVRASSQMISYEVALGLSLVGIMMIFSSVNLTEISNLQTVYLWKTYLQVGSFVGDFGLPAWGIFLQPVGFVLFFAAAFAETKRAPFDVPEGESEIIGYFVEYSGMKFGLFMISEFVEVVVLSALITVLFLGGYNLPFFGEALGRAFHDSPWITGTILGVVFWTKVVMLCWVQLLIRWTFPRFRYDQIQTLGWKILLPAGLINVFVTGALILWGEGTLSHTPFVESPNLRWLGIVGLLEIGLVLAMTAGAGEKSPAAASKNHAHADPHGHAHGATPAPAHSTH